MSLMNRPSPSSSGMASSGRTDLPTIFSFENRIYISSFSFFGRSRLLQLAHVACRGHHGGHDGAVAAAPADVARKRFANLLLRRVGVLLQKLDCRNQKPRRAIAALQAKILMKGFLDLVPLAAFIAKPLYGHNLGFVGLHRKRKAGAHAAPIDRYGAGAANAVLAAQMRAGQAQSVAQKVRQRLAHRHRFLVGTPVHLACYGLFLAHVTRSLFARMRLPAPFW